MRKRLLALVCALITVCAVVRPAFAASLSPAEQQLLDAFKQELQYWVDHTDFDERHLQQFYSEAENALLAVDLSDAACKEFESVLKQVHQVFVDHGCTTKAEMWECYPEVSKLVNDVGAKYYKLHVEVSDHKMDAVTGECNGHWATVTWEIDGKKSAVASVGGVTRQTGPDFAGTTGIVTVSVGTLCGSYYVARKKNLFVK